MNQEVVQPRSRECKLKEAEDVAVQKREAEHKKQLALQQLRGVSTGATVNGKLDPVQRQWRYDYAGEPFKVQGKTFWPLHALESIRRKVFPTLEHENDGLILQACLPSSASCLALGLNRFDA
jgi:hypothetical protein